MKKNRLIATLLAATCLAASVPAFADDHHGRGNGHGHGHGHDGGPPGHRPGGPHGDRWGHPGADNRSHYPMRWSKGERVPVVYRGRQYIVNDYRAYRLPPPPRGSQWISVGADYFLIGVATGIVLQSVLN